MFRFAVAATEGCDDTAILSSLGFSYLLREEHDFATIYLGTESAAARIGATAGVLGKTRCFGQAKEDHFFAGHGTDVMMHAQHPHAYDLVNH